ncbi:MAG: AarF/ABC1/UbiB kinase family protein [Deltaproteobacteria bacterium]|nr:MAG: AarF/ABC1/UbiB kinase family protein [Deltaproteobacteria bacterium]
MAHLTPSHDSRSLFQAARQDLRRFGRITSVLWRHGFGDSSRRAWHAEDADDTPLPEAAGPGIDAAGQPEETAERFRLVLQDLGPTFVKVGQILSTRPDLLPPPFIHALQRLQDDAGSVPFDEIRAVVETSLGAPLDELFASFTSEPLASASMAQAHLATLDDGTEVVVKVQRPGIGTTIRADLDLLRLLARLLEGVIAEMELYAPRDLVSALDDALMAELDFRQEARNLERFRENWADHDRIHVPACIHALTTAEVLTLERLHGQKVTGLAPGSARATEHAELLLELTYRSIFEHGFFHGDPHPGNVFALEDGRLGLIDFGMCGRLSRRQRDLIIGLILSVLAGDSDGIARSLLRMGEPMGHIPMSRFRADIEDIRERYLRRSLQEIDLSAFLDECMQAAQRYRIRIGGDYSILGKSVMTIEGVIRTLAPDFDLVAGTKPYAEQLVKDRFRPDELLQSAMTAALQVGNLVREVPEQLSQVLMDVESGSLEIKARTPDSEALRLELNRQVTRLSGALLGSALIIAAALVLPADPLVWRGMPWLTVLLGLGAAATFWLAFASHLLALGWRKLRITPLLRLFRRR